MDKTRPKWIDKYVGKGQTTRCKNGVYYLCSYHTEYSKEKGRGVTVIDRYLGRLDEERGLIPKKAKRDGLVITAPVEYGANAVLDRLCHEIYENLELCFGEQDAKEIFAIAKFGLSDKQPECRIDNVFINPNDPVETEAVLSAFFRTHPDVRHVVMFNSRIHLVVPYLQAHPDPQRRVVGFDNLKANMDALRAGTVSVLIGQRPDEQVNLAIQTLAEYAILGKLPPRKDHFMHMDILTSYNVEDY